MKVIFLGGDLRQKYACDYLNEHHIESIYIPNLIDLDVLKNADVLVLPLPVSLDGENLNVQGEYKTNNKLINIFEKLNENTLLLGGKFQIQIRKSIENHQLRYIDYYDVESFQIQNALLSAEGAIYYAKKRMNKSIHNSHIAILGFGRIGKILAFLTRSQGAKTTVYARGEIDRTWSKVAGIKALKIDYLGTQINDKIDIIFNTIPYNILNETILDKIQNDTLIIDLASKPYGINEKLLQNKKLNYHRELSIPGRYAPQSAGEILGQTIINILNKED